MNIFKRMWRALRQEDLLDEAAKRAGAAIAEMNELRRQYEAESNRHAVELLAEREASRAYRFKCQKRIADLVDPEVLDEVALVAEACRGRVVVAFDKDPSYRFPSAEIRPREQHPVEVRTVRVALELGVGVASATKEARAEVIFAAFKRAFDRKLMELCESAARSMLDEA